MPAPVPAPVPAPLCSPCACCSALCLPQCMPQCLSQALGVEGGEEGEGMCAALRRLRGEGTVAHVGLGMNSNCEAHQGVPHEVIRLLREVPS